MSDEEEQRPDARDELLAAARNYLATLGSPPSRWHDVERRLDEARRRLAAAVAAIDQEEEVA